MAARWEMISVELMAHLKEMKMAEMTVHSQDPWLDMMMAEMMAVSKEYLMGMMMELHWDAIAVDLKGCYWELSTVRNLDQMMVRQKVETMDGWMAGMWGD